MDISRQILSDFIIHTKYARYDKKKKRRETWNEIIDRYEKMMISKYPKLKDEIINACKYIREKKVFPSMRALQFAGRAIQKNPTRQYNCSGIIIDHPDVFKEIMFLLLSGTGVGISVQKQHIVKLPAVFKPTKKRRFLIGDSIEGWSEAVGALINSYLGNRKALPVFDYSDIREKGTPLKTSGGVAPGPADLKVALLQVQNILDSKNEGEQLTPLNVLDICCHIANCVVSGGIRRSSMLALFSFDDNSVKNCKSGSWEIENPQRAMVNISAAILRNKVTVEEFNEYFENIRYSKYAEPGIYMMNNSETYATNPCSSKNTRVNTPTGFKKVQDIKIGDKIITHKGIDKVKKIFKYKNRPVYKVNFKNLMEQNVTKGHIYHTKRGNVHVSNLKIGDKVLLAPCTLRNKRLSKKEFNKYLLKGILLGNGYYTKKKIELNNIVNVCCNQSEKKYNNNVKKLITNLGYILNKDDKDKKSLSVKFPIRKGNKVLQDLNLEPLYSYEKYIDFLDIDCKEKALAILNGLLITDGDINLRKNPHPSLIRFSTSSKRLAKDIIQLLLMVGCKSGVWYTDNEKGGIIDGRQIIQKHRRYQIYLAGESAIRFGNLIYDDVIHPKKKAQLNKFLMTCAGYPNKWYTKVTDIKADDYSDVYDLYCKNDTWVTEGLIQRGCSEIALKSCQFCNLTSINTMDLKDQKDFNERAKIASFLGTIQAGITNFHFLREKWQEMCESEPLLGISLSGIASGPVLNLNIKEAVEIIKQENKRISELINIKSALRLTCVKPDGTLSNVIGCSSGIHNWHSSYYIRRVRLNKEEPIYKYLVKKLPELIENDFTNPEGQGIFSIPIKAPDKAILRSETALQFLNRIKKIYKEWIVPGHVSGQNTHSVSCTVNVKEYEWDRVKEWLFENKEFYNGISLIPYNNTAYRQAPFEEINEEKYNEMIKYLKKIDLTKIVEEQDNTKLQQEIACGGGACEL